MAATLLDGDLPAELVRRIRSDGQVAIDTETSGLDWSTDQLQLCQIFAPSTGVVLLRNVTDTPTGLGQLLDDPGILKIFHFAPFDLRFLEAHWGLRARGISCTKAASKLLTPSAPPGDHSLQSLALRYLKLNLPKGRVRTSDWGAQSLSPEQIEYASNDVSHLIDLNAILATRIEEDGLTSLLADVCAYIPVDCHLEVCEIPNPLTY
ncbi:ribonuclease D [Mumia qirimensis]|uniref:ribonuclease D n=1 Tax=Mumia qirimensis TaxID=3234852 RepID=UPI00351DA114